MDRAIKFKFVDADVGLLKRAVVCTEDGVKPLTSAGACSIQGVGALSSNWNVTGQRCTTDDTVEATTARFEEGTLAGRWLNKKRVDRSRAR